MKLYDQATRILERKAARRIVTASNECVIAQPSVATVECPPVDAKKWVSVIQKAYVSAANRYLNVNTQGELAEPEPTEINLVIRRRRLTCNVYRSTVNRQAFQCYLLPNLRLLRFGVQS